MASKGLGLGILGLRGLRVRGLGRSHSPFWRFLDERTEILYRKTTCQPCSVKTISTSLIAASAFVELKIRPQTSKSTLEGAKPTPQGAGGLIFQLNTEFAKLLSAQHSLIHKST